MIVLSPLVRSGAPFGSGQSACMTSDVSVGELLDFANSIRLPLEWFHHTPGVHPHFEISPRYVGRALIAGARPVSQAEYAAAMRRFEAASRETRP